MEAETEKEIDKRVALTTDDETERFVTTVVRPSGPVRRIVVGRESARGHSNQATSGECWVVVEVCVGVGVCMYGSRATVRAPMVHAVLARQGVTSGQCRAGERTR